MSKFTGKVYPAPPGPTPTNDYEYLVVDQKAVPPNSPPTITSTMQIEGEIKMRMATAERRDLQDGRRVYRVLNQYLWRFDRDAVGAFIGRHPLPQFRFVLDDPTLDRATLNGWDPI